MKKPSRKIVIAISGSSGSIYAKRLLDILAQVCEASWKVGIVISDNAKLNWEIELGAMDVSSYPQFDFYEKYDFMAPFASGSANYDTMIVIPASMGIVGRIATGVSNDLTTRAADVMLKERRKLILVPRETPYSLIHLRNLTAITEAGGVVCPACPSFYSRPQTIEELVDTVVHRVLDLAAIEVDAYRWGESN